MAHCHHDICHSIILNCLHALYSSASAVLIAEIIHCHALDIAELCSGDNNRLIRDHIFYRDIMLIKSELCAALIAVFCGNFLKFLLYNSEQLVLVRKNFSQTCDFFHQFFVFRLNLSSFQTCQSSQTHIYNSLSLCIGKIKSLYKFFFGFLNIFSRTDDTYDFINVVKSNQQSFQDMCPLLSFIEVIFCSSGDHILLMDEIIYQNILQCEDLRLSLYQRKIIDTERILELRVFVELIQNYICICITANFNTDFHTLTAGMIIQRCDTIDFFISYKIGD